jgi:predicted DNA-binding transcriptional regulator AlpA
MQTANLPEVGFLRLPQVLKLVPVGRSSWWAGVAIGRYPKPVKLGPRTTAWKVEDIRKLIEQIGSSSSQDHMPKRNWASEGASHV